MLDLDISAELNNTHARQIYCLSCGAQIGEPCKTPEVDGDHPSHSARFKAFVEATVIEDFLASRNPRT